MHTFTTNSPPTLVVRTGSGHVSLETAETRETRVELVPLNGAARDALDDVAVEQRGETIAVTVPKHRSGVLRGEPRFGIEVTLPTDSRLEITSGSADIRATGTYAAATLSAGSGDLSVESVRGDARLKTGSGAVSTGVVEGSLVIGTGSGPVSVDHSARSATINVGSGDISIGELAGEVVAKTGSGDVEVGVLGGSLVTKSGSGDLTVRRATSGSVRANGASGDISIGICEGTAAWLDLSTLTGKVIQELGETDAPREGQQRLEVSAHTVSGDLRVHRS